jgi:DUF4097 and DUF4098 domain-containing protein YvlB
MRGLVLLGLIGVAMIFFAGCTSPAIPGGGVVQEEFHGEYALLPGASLQVNNLNGDISIAGSHNQTLVVHAVKTSLYGQTELDKVSIEVQNGSEAIIATKVPPAGARVAVRYEILVPGSVLVEKVYTTNGDIGMKRVNGDAVVGTTNGNLDLSDLAGTISATSTNGNIIIHDIGNITDLHTTNGQVSGTLGHVTGNPAVISTSNGAVTLVFTRDLSSPLSVSASNGPVAITIPEIFNANVDLSTTNGQILLQGLTVSEVSGTARHQAGVIGNGGPGLVVTTTNGNIILVGV